MHAWYEYVEFCKELPECLPKCYTILHFHQQWIQVLGSLYPLQYLVFWSLTIKSLVVVSCCFTLHVPNDIWCRASFHVLICHLYTFFNEASVQIFCPFLSGLFVFLLLIFNLFVYFKYHSYQIMSFKNTLFPPSLWLVFSFYWHYLSILILMKSSLSILPFMDHTCDVISKKLLLCPRSSRFSPLIPSKNFIVLCDAFRNTMHFELIFMKGCKVCV